MLTLSIYLLTAILVIDCLFLVLLVLVRSGSLGVRVEPPLGDRVPLGGLLAVGLEDRAEIAHLVRTRTAFRLDEYRAATVRRRIARVHEERAPVVAAHEAVGVVHPRVVGAQLPAPDEDE